LFADKIEFGFSDNSNGNLDFRFDSADIVNQKRGEFFTQKGIDPKSSAVMVAEHKNRIFKVLQEDAGKGVASSDNQYLCDGLITREKNLNLILSVADCIALTLYDEANENLAIVHVGSKNLANGTIGKVAESMREMANADMDIHATTGPFIKKCCYKFDKIPEQLKSLGKYFIQESENLYSLDTETALKDQLLASGVKETNIEISPLCSKHDDFPSHRSYQDTGRGESRMLVYARMV